VGLPLSGYTELTPGALKALGAAELLIAESLRTASTLYKKNGLMLPQTLLLSEHTRPAEIEPLFAEIQKHRSVLISDAGLPVLADPGSQLIRLCHRRGWPVAVEAGGTAATVALSLAGLGNEGYLFLGFLPRENRERKAAIQKIASQTVPVVLYETPYRLGRVLLDIKETLAGKPLRVFLVTEIGAGMQYVDLALNEIQGQSLSGRPVIIIYRSGLSERV